jgi:hypothetical protein
MALTITDSAITSDLVSTRADFSQHPAVAGFGSWIVSGWPGRRFTRVRAIAIVQLAEEKARLDADKLLAELERELHQAGE